MKNKTIDAVDNIAVKSEYCETLVSTVKEYLDNLNDVRFKVDKEQISPYMFIYEYDRITKRLEVLLNLYSGLERDMAKSIKQLDVLIGEVEVKEFEHDK